MAHEWSSVKVKYEKTHNYFGRKSDFCICLWFSTVNKAKHSVASCEPWWGAFSREIKLKSVIYSGALFYPTLRLRARPIKNPVHNIIAVLSVRCCCFHFHLVIWGKWPYVLSPASQEKEDKDSTTDTSWEAVLLPICVSFIDFSTFLVYKSVFINQCSGRSLVQGSTYRNLRISMQIQGHVCQLQEPVT